MRRRSLGSPRGPLAHAPTARPLRRVRPPGRRLQRPLLRLLRHRADRAVARGGRRLRGDDGRRASTSRSSRRPPATRRPRASTTSSTSTIEVTQLGTTSMVTTLADPPRRRRCSSRASSPTSSSTPRRSRRSRSPSACAQALGLGPQRRPDVDLGAHLLDHRVGELARGRVAAEVDVLTPPAIVSSTLS